MILIIIILIIIIIIIFIFHLIKILTKNINIEDNSILVVEELSSSGQIAGMLLF